MGNHGGKKMILAILFSIFFITNTANADEQWHFFSENEQTYSLGKPQTNLTNAKVTPDAIFLAYMDSCEGDETITVKCDRLGQMKITIIPTLNGAVSNDHCDQKNKTETKIKLTNRQLNQTADCKKSDRKKVLIVSKHIGTVHGGGFSSNEHGRRIFLDKSNKPMYPGETLSCDFFGNCYKNTSGNIALTNICSMTDRDSGNINIPKTKSNMNDIFKDATDGELDYMAKILTQGCKSGVFSYSDLPADEGGIRKKAEGILPPNFPGDGKIHGDPATG